jgi:fatty-acyl-CoA synthase
MSPIIDPVATHAGARPSACAVVDLESGRQWSYRALDSGVDRLAAWLVDQFGPASGTRVATLAKNCAEMLILQLACARAGAVFVPYNWRLAIPEIAELIADARPELIFHDSEFSTATGSVRRMLMGDMTALGTEGARPPGNARRGFDDPMTLLYTSGTSGRPKGVIVTEANAFWGSINFVHGNGVTTGSVFLCDMPMFHTAGLFAAARTPILAGATVLISNGFDAERTLARLADRSLGITHYFSVPQMATMMWNAPCFEPEMLGGLHVYAMGGAPNPAAQIERFVRAGVPMSDGFGMSETGSNFGMPVGDADVLLAKAGSCGRPYLSVRARIVNEVGEDLPTGQVGELWLAGPSVTPGYWGQPALSAQAFQDGWFRTGDAARCDADGYYYIVDRRKDMFISGGENVYPAEVEAKIAELPWVAEVAVIGIPDERWGEVGCAYYVPVAGHDGIPDEIIAHCTSRLARYKVPKFVISVESIPRTASGKAQKYILRREPS